MSDVRCATIFIVAGEASGDQHAAMLAEALLERSEVRLVGVGQQRMRQAGVELLFDSAGWSAIGLMEGLKRVPKLLRRARQIIGWLSQHPPDLVVLVDFGAFNVRLGRQLKRRQKAPILYYFPPRSWSRSARGHESLAKIVDRVATPFQWSAELLRGAGIDATWVGHPVVDRIEPPQDRGPLRAELGLRADAPTVGILPGSRPAEIHLIAPLALAAAKIIRETLPDAQLVMSVAPTVKPEDLERQVRTAGLPGVRLAPGTADIVCGADLTISCSGTATLEAAAAGCPMVVVYRGTPLMRLEYVLRPKFEHIALPNIIAGRRIVPELLDSEATPPAVAEAALSLLGDPARLAQTRRELLEVRATLGPPGVSGRVAAIALEMLEGGPRTSDLGPTASDRALHERRVLLVRCELSEVRCLRSDVRGPRRAMTGSAEAGNRNNVAAQLSITAAQNSSGAGRLWAYARAFLVRRRTFLGMVVAFALLLVADPRLPALVAGAVLMAGAHTLRLVSSGYLNKDETLVTRGPFAWCRNPLYLGNFLVSVSFVAMSGQWPALPLVLLLCTATQVPTVTCEEQFLREKFGQRFENYCRRVPRWLPRIPRRRDESDELAAQEPGFSWTRVLGNQEHLNIISAWLVAAMFIVEMAK